MIRRESIRPDAHSLGCNGGWCLHLTNLQLFSRKMTSPPVEGKIMTYRTANKRNYAEPFRAAHCSQQHFVGLGFLRCSHTERSESWKVQGKKKSPQSADVSFIRQTLINNRNREFERKHRDSIATATHVIDLFGGKTRRAAKSRTMQTLGPGRRGARARAHGTGTV